MEGSVLAACSVMGGGLEGLRGGRDAAKGAPASSSASAGGFTGWVSAPGEPSVSTVGASSPRVSSAVCSSGPVCSSATSPGDRQTIPVAQKAEEEEKEEETVQEEDEEE